mgnify:CR=1 FL=1
MKLFDFLDNSNGEYSFTSPSAEKENDDAEEAMFRNRFTKNRTTIGNSFNFG